MRIRNLNWVKHILRISNNPVNSWWFNQRTHQGRTNIGKVEDLDISLVKFINNITINLTKSCNNPLYSDLSSIPCQVGIILIRVTGSHKDITIICAGLLQGLLIQIRQQGNIINAAIVSFIADLVSSINLDWVPIIMQVVGNRHREGIGPNKGNGLLDSVFRWQNEARVKDNRTQNTYNNCSQNKGIRLRWSNGVQSSRNLQSW